MAEVGQAEKDGKYVEAEDVLGGSNDKGDTEDGSETETETESGTETETEEESGSDEEFESELESETEPESELTDSQDDGASHDGKNLPAERVIAVEDDGSATTAEEVALESDSRRPSSQPHQAAPHLPPVENSRASGILEPQIQHQADGSKPGTATQQPAPHLPQLEGTRFATPSQQLSSSDGTRVSISEWGLVDPFGESQSLSLPLAGSRNPSRDASRRSSHLEASTSGPALHQSSSSLPPINQQKSVKSNKAHTTSAPASRRSRASSPRQGSPTRNPNAAPRYYQPPPPPPPPPKPKPRERHDTSAVDPLFLQTAVYRTVPNVGRVYDWKLQHEVNAALSKQRKQKVQMDKVLEAARVQLQVREANERAFQQWMAAKEMEKQQQSYHNRRVAYVTSVYQSLLKEDPVERKTRESLWVSNFAYTSSPAIPGRPNIARATVSEGSERFRL